MSSRGFELLNLCVRGGFEGFWGGGGKGFGGIFFGDFMVDRWVFLGKRGREERGGGRREGEGGERGREERGGGRREGEGGKRGREERGGWKNMLLGDGGGRRGEGGGLKGGCFSIGKCVGVRILGVSDCFLGRGGD